MCCGFLVLVMSKTKTMQYFAIVNSAAILLVTLSVLTVLPALVALFHINDERKQRTGSSQ
jgi:predicted RND superfamily exporter protein